MRIKRRRINFYHYAIYDSSSYPAITYEKRKDITTGKKVSLALMVRVSVALESTSGRVRQQAAINVRHKCIPLIIRLPFDTIVPVSIRRPLYTLFSRVKISCRTHVSRAYRYLFTPGYKCHILPVALILPTFIAELFDLRFIQCHL